MDHFAVCRPLMTEDQLDTVRNFDEHINAKFEALGDDYELDEYHKIMDEQVSNCPFLDEQQASYEAYLDSVVKNFPELEGISRAYLSDTLNFYFEYYFGEGGPHASEASCIIYRLTPVMDGNQAYSHIVK